MSVEIEKEVECQFDFELDELVLSVIEECLDYEKCPYESRISVTFTDNETIKKINNEFRQIDSATDVLSFPMVEYGKPGDFSVLEGEDDYAYSCFDPDSGELVLGDIVISVERAKEQAEEYGHSLRREIGFLIAHSMFHLFGYDHIDENEREEMEKRQREVLDRLNIVR